MTVETVINPIDNSEVTIVAGVIERITYKDLTGDRYGNTHNANMLVDGVWINFIPLKTPDGRSPQLRKVTGQKPDLKYEDIHEGDTVKVVVKVGEFRGSPSYSAKSSKINIIAKGEGKSAKPAAKVENAKPKNTPSAAKSQEGTKIYGQVKSLENGKGIVIDKNSDKEFPINLQDNPEVEVGHSVGAFVSATGDILNNFKHYPPKQSNGKKADAWGSPERNFKMSFGNMVNVAALAIPKGSQEEIFNYAQKLYPLAAELREKLLKEFEGERDEGDVGGKLGDALKHSASSHGNNSSAIITGAEDWFRSHVKAEEELKDLLSGKPRETSAVVEEEFDDTPSDEDYDSDVPF